MKPHLIEFKVKTRSDSENPFSTPSQRKRLKLAAKGKMALFPPKMACKGPKTTVLSRMLGEKTVLANLCHILGQALFFGMLSANL